MLFKLRERIGLIIHKWSGKVCMYVSVKQNLAYSYSFKIFVQIAYLSRILEKNNMKITYSGYHHLTGKFYDT